MQIPNLADAEDATQAQVDSRDFSDILSPAFTRTGVLSNCAVTAQGTPDMTVAVSAGFVVVSGVVVTVVAGNVTISANVSGNSRFDLICVDAAGVKSAVAGAPSTSPVFPNPAGKVVLAAVRVPTGAASISNAKIVDKRVFNTLTTLAFGAAGDTNLYRNGAGILKTDGFFHVGGPTYLGGTLYFGFAGDTYLYRNAANALRTDGSFDAASFNMGVQIAWTKPQAGYMRSGDVITQMMRATAGVVVLAVGQPADTTEHLRIFTDGLHAWGPGNAATDVNLYRASSQLLATDSAFSAARAAGALGTVLLGWAGNGYGVLIGADTNLYRSAAGILKTDGRFITQSLAIGNSQVAAVGGANVAKFPIYDAAGTLLGYVPIYAS